MRKEYKNTIKEFKSKLIQIIFNSIQIIPHRCTYQSVIV
jgi:hypothetical protein